MNLVNIYQFFVEDFYVRLTSSEPFAFSYSYEFCDNETYFYNNMLPSLTPIKSDDEDFYRVDFDFNTPYRNAILSDNEFFAFTIKVEKKPEQKLTLDYAQHSSIDSIVDEKLDNSSEETDNSEEPNVVVYPEEVTTNTEENSDTTDDNEKDSTDSEEIVVEEVE